LYFVWLAPESPYLSMGSLEFGRNYPEFPVGLFHRPHDVAENDGQVADAESASLYVNAFVTNCISLFVSN